MNQTTILERHLSDLEQVAWRIIEAADQIGRGLSEREYERVERVVPDLYQIAQDLSGRTSNDDEAQGYVECRIGPLGQGETIMEARFSFGDEAATLAALKAARGWSHGKYIMVLNNSDLCTVLNALLTSALSERDHDDDIQGDEAARLYTETLMTLGVEII